MYRVLMASIFALGLIALATGEKSFAQEKAVSAKDKKATCEFGADDQKLKGNERKSFMTKCMAKDVSETKAKPKPKPKPKKKEEKSDG